MKHILILTKYLRRNFSNPEGKEGRALGLFCQQSPVYGPMTTCDEPASARQITEAAVREYLERKLKEAGWWSHRENRWCILPSTSNGFRQHDMTSLSKAAREAGVDTVEIEL